MLVLLYVVMFSRFLKVAIARSDFMKIVYMLSFAVYFLVSYTKLRTSELISFIIGTLNFGTNLPL